VVAVGLWTVPRPDVTWDGQWTVEPTSQPLFSVLDEALYLDGRPVVSGDRAFATRPKQRFSVGFLERWVDTASVTGFRSRSGP
jgi:hypothetical protein